MKHTLLIYVAIITMNIPLASAQDMNNNQDRQEFRLGIGNWSYPQVFQGLHKQPFLYNEFPTDAFSGVYSFSYRYFLSRKIAFGVGAAYEIEGGHCQTAQYYGNLQEFIPYAVFIKQEFTIAPELTFVYSHSHTRNISVIAYGYAGAGICFQTGRTITQADNLTLPPSTKISLSALYQQLTDKKQYAIGQFCPIAISYGGRFRGFAELGYGYKGVFNMGIMLKV